MNDIYSKIYKGILFRIIIICRLKSWQLDNISTFMHVRVHLHDKSEPYQPIGITRASKHSQENSMHIKN